MRHKCSLGTFWGQKNVPGLKINSPGTKKCTRATLFLSPGYFFDPGTFFRTFLVVARDIFLSRGYFFLYPGTFLFLVTKIAKIQLSIFLKKFVFKIKFYNYFKQNVGKNGKTDFVSAPLVFFTT